MVIIFFEKQIKTEENSPDHRTRRPPPFDRRPPQRQPPPENVSHYPPPAFNTKRIFKISEFQKQRKNDKNTHAIHDRSSSEPAMGKWLCVQTPSAALCSNPECRLATRRSHFFRQRAEFIVFEMARQWRVRMSTRHIN